MMGHYIWFVRVTVENVHIYEERSQEGEKSYYCLDAMAGRILTKLSTDDVVTHTKFDINQFMAGSEL